MNLAYGWALFNPVRKVYYNLAITGLSVAVCFAIGGIEALGLLPQEVHGLSRTHGFWAFMAHFNINSAGFVIAGMFIATWLAAVLIWRFGRIEQKWAVRLQPARPGGTTATPVAHGAPGPDATSTAASDWPRGG
jgi:nickel/cobalt transporter (NiCoT) family protein